MIFISLMYEARSAIEIAENVRYFVLNKLGEKGFVLVDRMD